ncbi:MAG TPA: IgA Peptidase M64 [Clostridia bacterium]|nr:IgA Peptidase M64 [Clostridia bacterium]
MAIRPVCAQVQPASTATAPRTMRVDYFHTGNSKTETFSLERVVLEPLAWPGSMAEGARIDRTNFGKYFFEVRDQKTGDVLYSRGFSSIYGEWELTPEAEKMNRTYSESFRFPAPEAPVTIVLKKRDQKNEFREIWKTEADPTDMLVDNSKPPSAGPLITVEKNGDSATKVDFLILGDGYMAAQRGKCENDARRLFAILFSTPPFQQRRKDFNVWALCPAATESGISRPSTGIHLRPPAGSTYDAFRSERYILTFDNRAFRDLASQAPYEFVEVLTNTNTYGGGGIFGLYSTVAADSEWAPYVFVHEFGHHFAGLADEYYTSDVAYGPATQLLEPWEPNATALRDPKLLKWRDLVSSDTPVPTPWNKDEFEKYSRSVQEKRRAIRKANRPESEMDALFREERQHEDKMLADEKYAGKVGAFEGANYEAKGYYRPQANCIMFTRTDHFCQVCQRAIEQVIDLYARH